jgi:signal transduction histidine kinase
VIDSGQLLERFRLLSREIQNGLQTAQKQIDSLKKSRSVSSDADKVSSTLADMSEAWLDFSGWVLISTLDDLNEARANSAPGRVDLQSKLNRSKIRRKNDTARNGVSVDVTGCESIVIETYIPYFEQMLDLIFGNAIKYSSKGGAIEVACSRSKLGGATISIRSIGPVVQKHEVSSLGGLGFRCEHAKKLPVTGQGYGLFNAKRLASLIGAEIDFRTDVRVLYEIGGVSFANFSVLISLPEVPPFAERA